MEEEEEEADEGKDKLLRLVCVFSFALSLSLLFKCCVKSHDCAQCLPFSPPPLFLLGCQSVRAAGIKAKRVIFWLIF